MEADRDPQGGQDIHAQQQAKVRPAEAPAPQEDGDGTHAQERQDDCQKVCHLEAQGKALRWLVSGQQLGVRVSNGQNANSSMKHLTFVLQFRSASAGATHTQCPRRG